MIVAVEPGDVGESSVPSPDVLSVGAIPCDTVLQERGEPTARLDRIKEDQEAVPCCQSEHRVDSREVGRVRPREVAGCLERAYAVPGAPVGAATRIPVTDEVDPKRIEPCSLATPHEARSLPQRQVHKERLRRVARDQEGNVVLVDEISPRTSAFERERGNDRICSRPAPQRYSDRSSAPRPARTAGAWSLTLRAARTRQQQTAPVVRKASVSS